MKNARKIIELFLDDKPSVIQDYNFTEDDFSKCEIEFVFYENSSTRVPYVIDKSIMSVVYQNPNGSWGNDKLEIIDSNRALVTLSGWAIDNSGTVKAMVQGYDTDGRLSFGDFKFKVKKDFGPMQLEETDKFSLLTKLISETSTIISDEKQRISNEVARISNEKLRQESENYRNKDYESLKKIIIDENQAANLQDQIKEVNSQLEYIEQNALCGKAFRYITQAEYDELSEADKNNDNIVWMITDTEVVSSNNIFSPDGSKWELKVSNSGVLSAEKVFVKAERVTLNITNHTLYAEQTVQLIATVLPQGANQNVVWSTSNANVATVVNGLVNAIGGGTAIITVTTVDGGFKSNCNLTVNAPIVFTNYMYNTETYTNPTTSEHPNKGTYYLKTGVGVEILNGVFKGTKTSATGSSSYLLIKHNIADNKKYYIRGLVKTNSNSCIAGQSVYEKPIVGDNNWHLASYIIDDTSISSKNFSVKTNDGNTGDVFEVKELMRVCLTDIYGVGSEPDLDTCDSTFTTYKTGLIG